MASEGRALVSVIMPVYNTPAVLLDRAVGSVLSQPYRDVELLLVDDGSDSDCAGQCDLLARSDGRVKVIHQSNAGVSAARNAALDVASGEWVMFVDGDDELLPNAIGRGVLIGSSNALDIVYGEVVDSDGDYRRVRDFKMTEEGGLAVKDDPAFLRALEAYFVSYESLNRQTVPRSLSVGPVSRLFRIESVRGVRFETRLKILEDALFNSVVVSRVKRVGFVCEPWYVYHKYHGSATRTMGFDDGSREHCEVVLQSVTERGIPMNAYYSQICTYFFFVLNSLSASGGLSYSALREGYCLPWFREAFAKFDRKAFDYPTSFAKLKYRLACEGRLFSLWLLYKFRDIAIKARGQ